MNGKGKHTFDLVGQERNIPREATVAGRLRFFATVVFGFILSRVYSIAATLRAGLDDFGRSVA